MNAVEILGIVVLSGFAIWLWPFFLGLALGYDIGKSAGVALLVLLGFVILAAPLLGIAAIAGGL